MDNRAPAHEEDEIDLLEMMRFFLRNYKLILSVTVIVTVVTGAILSFKHGVYKAGSALLLSGVRTEVLFEPRIQTKDDFEKARGSFDVRRKTIEVILTNDSIVKELVKQLSGSFINEKNNIDSLKNCLKLSFEGEIFKLDVISDTAEKAKELSDKWTQLGADKINELFSDNLNHVNIVTKIGETKNVYNRTNKDYSNYVLNNQVLKISKELDNLRNMYSYYKESIISIEKLVWQAKAIQQQVEGSSDVGVSNLSNQLALLKFKATVFAGGTELPLKFDISSQAGNNLQVTQSDKKLIIEDLANLIKLFENRKKEFIQILEKDNYEQRIQELENKLNSENNKKAELEKNKTLAWDTLTTLERKKEEMSISKGIQNNVFVKIAYFSELPEKPEPLGRLIVLLLTFIISLIAGIFVSFLKEIVSKI